MLDELNFNLKLKIVPQQRCQKLVDLIRQVYRVRSNNLSQKMNLEPTNNNYLKILMCKTH